MPTIFENFETGDPGDEQPDKNDAAETITLIETEDGLKIVKEKEA